jgi:drug/metabolite transporter (DMT)-like permease
VAVVGSIRGTAILLANWLLLIAAGLLPGYVVFAAYGASIVMVNVVAAILIWRERPRGRALGGILLAAVAIVLFNV